MDKKIHVAIESREGSPLVMHCPDLLMRQSPGSKPRPEVEAAMGRYLVPGTEHLCIPEHNMRACILEAARSFKVAAKLTAARVLGACMQVEPVHIPLLDKKGKPIVKYELDVRPAVVGKARVIRSRPMILQWRAEYDVVYDDEMLPDEKLAQKILRQVHDHAGLYVGLMDMRPSSPKKPGRCGKFQVVEFQVGKA